jgi:tRNA (mo5U34)-methyltransferase
MLNGPICKSDSEQALAEVKNRIWFYEFELPDGSFTRSDIPPGILRIHTSRRDHLARVIAKHVENPDQKTALDFASHEGYYSLQLAKVFKQVQGLEIRSESLDAARMIASALDVKNVTYSRADLQKMEIEDRFKSDFVLVYGLIYHLENPIHALRLASNLSNKHILIETQVFPYDINGRIEDGQYANQRQVHGVFSLSADYKDWREGGSTDLALVPSLNALIYLMKAFGFNIIEVLQPTVDDYEQFCRGSRVIVYGEK